MSFLSKLLILDLADEKASFCTKLLAGMGARVIKIEKPGGDSSRCLGPFLNIKPHPEESLSFRYNNTDKQGITLNLEKREGHSLFLKLVQRADIIVETFSPGYLEKLGLDFATLSEENPRIIMASVTGFGQTGPHTAYKSNDIVAAAAGGQMYVSGNQDRQPLLSYGQQSYYTAALFAATGIMIALRERNHSGRGQHLDISLQESVAATLEQVMVRYLYENIVPVRQGSLHWSNTAGLLPCRDGYLFMTFDREWETLVELLDAEGMAADTRESKWLDGDYRRQHSEYIIEVLSNWTRTHTTAELFELGQLMRFPWAPVCSPQQVFDSPQLQARDFFTPVAHQAENTSYMYPGNPYKFSGVHESELKRSPSVGEHNLWVYNEELGLSFKEITRLQELDVI